MSVGVPIKLFHEAENHIITIEVKTGELYRGYLTEAEVDIFFSLKYLFPLRTNIFKN